MAMILNEKDLDLVSGGVDDGYVEVSVKCPVPSCKKINYVTVAEGQTSVYVCCIRCGTSFTAQL